jgi:hypothetical protein
MCSSSMIWPLLNSTWTSLLTSGPGQLYGLVNRLSPGVGLDDEDTAINSDGYAETSVTVPKNSHRQSPVCELSFPVPALPLASLK